MNALVNSLLDPEVTQHPVRMFLESRDSIQRFSSHFRRTANPLIRKYAVTVESVLSLHTSHPTDAGSMLVSKVASDCRGLLEASQNGERQRISVLLPQAMNRVMESEAMIKGFGPAGIGSSGTITEDSKYADDHDAFVRKFCKNFGVKEDHHEGVAEGLYVYFDPENTKELLGNLQFDISNYCFENGYILLRSGSVDDFSFGSFGEELSKWGFVYLEQPEQ